MELLWVVTLTIMFVRWMYLRRKFQELERRIETLLRAVANGPAMASAAVQPWDLRVYPRATMPRPSAPPRVVVARPVPPAPEAAPVDPSVPAAPRDWEALVGGNLLNKVGMLLLVIGIALALGYSFTYMGPAGRVATSLAVSAGMIASGVIVERRELYRTFARGLIGGGWAALYITVYAMHALDAARVIQDPLLAAILLTAVAAGMIVHSLRYRSQTVTGLAYFVGFATLAVTDSNALSVGALAPLAGSLLFVARRFEWRHFAMAAAAATYITIAVRGDSGAPLWQAQTVFALYWVLFEVYDLLSEEAWLWPLNAAGFLGLSIVKWEAAAPGRLWEFLLAAAVAYGVSAAIRVRSGRWHGPLTVAAGLAASASLLKLGRDWNVVTLLMEAELLYLTGVRLRSRFLRWVGYGVFAIEVLRVLSGPHDVTWTSLMVLTIAVFYANRVLEAADVGFGYAAATLAAILAQVRAPNGDYPLAWLLLGCAAFLVKRRDFLYQACGLGALAVTGMVLRPGEPPLSMALAVAALYGAALMTPAARLVHVAASGLLALLLYRQVSGSVLTVAWAAQGVALLTVGFPLRDRVLRLCGIGLLAVCILKLFVHDLSFLDTLPRIFSFIVLGLLLVGVSFVYTRFRDRLQRYL